MLEGARTSRDPKNVFQPLGDRSFPYRRTMLAIKVLRLFSMLLGIATIAFVFETALLIFPGRFDTASLAASLVALNPMFLFISNSVNNDNAVMAVCSAVAYLGIRLGREGMIPRRAFALGMLCGVAVLTKLSGLVALPFLMALWGFTPGPWREKVRASLIAVIALLLVAGPWFAWNIHVTGDPTAMRLHRELAGNARPRMDLLAIAREWDGCFKSYWGVFGNFNVIYPDAVYYGLMGFSSLCVALYLLHLVRRRLRVEPALHALTVMALSNLAALVIWTSLLWGSQGRLLFPSILAISILSAVGITSVHPGASWPFTVVIILALAVLALSGGAWVIPAQYPI